MIRLVEGFLACVGLLTVVGLAISWLLAHVDPHKDFGDPE